MLINNIDDLFKEFDKDILNFYQTMVISLKENHNQTPNNQSQNCMSIEKYTVNCIWLSKVVHKFKSSRFQCDIKDTFYEYALKLINRGK